VVVSRMKASKLHEMSNDELSVQLKDLKQSFLTCVSRMPQGSSGT
jgi:ribosomal protein L29